MQISTITVLGAGTMGRGIAHVSALAGYETHLYDTSAEALKKAQATIHKNLAKGVELKKVDAEAAGRAKPASICTTTWRESLSPGPTWSSRPCPRTMALKIETFRTVSRHAPEHALFGSQHLGPLDHRDGRRQRTGPSASPACTSSTPST